MYIGKKSAVKIFYYLMAIDGSIGDDEFTQLNSMGEEIDGGAFQSYKVQLIQECEAAVREANGIELYDILSENVDKAISDQVTGVDDGIPSRLLLWNMLVMALVNQKYDESEKRLIHHVARLCGLNNSVLSEMESNINTIAAIDNELLSYQESSLPYSEIRPIVAELELRKKTITRSVTELISDELYEAVQKVEAKDDFIDKSKAYVAEKAAPVVNKVSAGVEKSWQEIKEKSAPVVEKSWQEIKEKSAPVVEDTKKAFGKALGNIKSKLKSGSSSADDTDTWKRRW